MDPEDWPDDEFDDLDLDESSGGPSSSSASTAEKPSRTCFVCSRDISQTAPTRPCPYCGTGRNWFRCRNCGQTSLKFSRRCSFCRFVHGLYRVDNVSHTVRTAVQAIADLPANPMPRIETHVEPFDKLMGGGLAVGSVTLLWGDPGTGKSTLLLQVCGACNVDVLYVSGEEPLEQLTSRALRLGIDKAPHIRLMRSQTTEEVLVALTDLQPRILVIDSVQAFRSETIDGIEGGHAQVRHLVNEIVAVIKHLPCAVILVGQVTADGRVAGPSRMRHWVDVLAVMRMEPHRGQFRSLYAPKNRFGPAKLVIPLEMTELGLVEREPMVSDEDKPKRSRLRKGRGTFPL